jgi:sarcosine oxidase subunit beta
MSIELPRTADVVITGGGVMGASAAYHLSMAGVQDVVLVEKDEGFGLGASGRCAGGVRYQFGTEVNVRLSIESLAMLERFKQDTGQECYYRQCGYLFVLTDENDIPVFKHNRAMQRRLGVDVEWVSGGEIRSRLPMMRFEDAIAGTFHSKDGLADPNSVVMGYLARARQLGVKTYTGVEVLGMELSSGRVQSVTTSRGDISCGQVINAAGPWAGLVGEMAGVSIPISPIRRQMVTTTPLPDVPKDYPFVIDFSQSLYFHGEGEGILTGMSNPDQAPGYDQSIDKEWDLVAMEAAVRRLPMLEGAGRLSGWAGLYEVTPDAHPIFGPTQVEGFWVVGGFSGHGFMHGPIAGLLMAEFLTEGEASTVDVSMLDLARFDEDDRPIQEYNVI